MGSTVFTPDMEESIRVVKQYDSTLKYALFTFGIVRDIDDNDVGMNNIDKAACIVTVCVFVLDNPQKLAVYGTQDEDKQNKNTTQYVLDTTLRKQTQIT